MARSLLVWGLDNKDWTAEQAVLDEHGDLIFCWLWTVHHARMHHHPSSTLFLLLRAVSWL
jgi:hypothetical protein